MTYTTDLIHQTGMCMKRHSTTMSTLDLTMALIIHIMMQPITTMQMTWTKMATTTLACNQVITELIMILLTNSLSKNLRNMIRTLHHTMEMTNGISITSIIRQLITHMQMIWTLMVNTLSTNNMMTSDLHMTIIQGNSLSTRLISILMLVLMDMKTITTNMLITHMLMTWIQKVIISLM